MLLGEALLTVSMEKIPYFQVLPRMAEVGAAVYNLPRRTVAQGRPAAALHRDYIVVLAAVQEQSGKETMGAVLDSLSLAVEGAVALGIPEQMGSQHPAEMAEMGYPHHFPGPSFIMAGAEDRRHI